MSSEFVVRVERGHASPEELAAITAVLMARAANRPAEAAEPRTIAHWRRLERAAGFYAPHSWQAVA